MAEESNRLALWLPETKIGMLGEWYQRLANDARGRTHVQTVVAMPTKKTAQMCEG
jgi:hypothetical protein